MARTRKKAKRTTYARRVMIQYLRDKTGKISLSGNCPSTKELINRCEDHLNLSVFLNMSKAQKMERIMAELEETYRKDRPKRPPVKEVSFYNTDGWRDLRYRALKLSDGKCECCGRGKHDGAVLHVDHIKPRSKYPELQWDMSNLQILCADCNLGKRAWDETDWREPRLVVLMGERVDD
jgi:5-methylcytosine-specific restriction endonuclease McrA